MTNESEQTHSTTAVLLPTASVSVFSTHDDTLDVLKALKDDWRFARIEVSANKGDVETAIETYQRYASPNLLIIQTDVIDASFTEKLGELAGFCEEKTSAIVVGPTNDITLYRKLVGMGVSDYLVQPVKKEVISEIIAKSLLNKLGVMNSRLLVVCGTKGGVGTSTIAQACALSASEILEQKTLILDVAGGYSTLGVGMGFDPSTTLAEAARAANKGNMEDFDRMLFEASDKLKALASGGDVMLERPITHGQMEVILDIALSHFPLVILDVSGASETLRKKAIVRANTIFLVTTPVLSALRLSRSLIHEIQSLRSDAKDALKLVINMVGINQATEVPQSDIKEALDMEPLGSIDFAPKLFMGCETEGQKLTETRDGDQVIRDKITPILCKSILSHLNITKEIGSTSSNGGGFFDSLFKKK